MTDMRVPMLSSRERCSTGISELDAMLTGGIPRGRTILIEGPPGSGKTILSLHFLVSGILEDPTQPEPGILVCMDESPKDLIREASVFGWDLGRLIDLKQLILIDAYSGRLGLKPELPYAIPIGKFDIDTIKDRISEAQKDISATRLVIDPVSALLDGHDGPARRKTVLSLAALLSRLSLTTFLNSELSEAGMAIERYVAHGVIRLTYDRSEAIDEVRVKPSATEIGRRLRIVKMRETAHSMSSIPYEITSKGITLKA
jgi:circadian clock protein KaiC